jgi:hypothetical protein
MVLFAAKLKRRVHVHHLSHIEGELSPQSPANTKSATIGEISLTNETGNGISFQNASHLGNIKLSECKKKRITAWIEHA